LTLLLSELDPLQFDKSGLEKTEEERANKIIDDGSHLGVAKLMTPEDILTGNEQLNLLFCAELFSKNNSLETQQKYNEEDRKNFARIINEKLKDDKDLNDVLPLNHANNSLFTCLKDGIILK